MLKFGIIGFGFMGQTHAHTIDGKYGEVIAVADTNPEQLKEAFGNMKCYNTADELLAIDEIETVVVSVPNNIHYDVVIKAAHAKKNIILEKPAAMSSKQFEEMIAVCNAEDVKLTIHHQRRFDKDYRIAKEVFESKKLGDVYTIKNQLYGFNGNMHDWHIYPELGGGMLYDWGVHLLDQMLWMIPGKLTHVYADVRNVINNDVDDYFNIQLHFENGIRGQVELGTYMLSDKTGWFERHWFVAGSTGTAYIDGFHPEGKIVRTTQLLENVDGKITMTAAGPTRSFGPAPEGRIVTETLPKVDVYHEMFFENYLRESAGQDDYIIKPHEILRLMRLLEAIWESSESKSVVEFEK